MSHPFTSTFTKGDDDDLSARALRDALRRLGRQHPDARFIGARVRQEGTVVDVEVRGRMRPTWSILAATPLVAEATAAGVCACEGCREVVADLAKLVCNIRAAQDDARLELPPGTARH
ncbi:MAG: hypothetical protein KGL39_32975 [Patescibacteria group bacterium]|nr:hypothetical protein [Patescibacteria group bacterium]